MDVKAQATEAWEKHWREKHGRREPYSTAELGAARKRGEPCEDCAREANRRLGSWEDQPAEVLGYPIALSTHVSSRVVEVRDAGGRYYVTAGNLWGSQTVLCESPAAMLAVQALAMAAKTGTQRDLPEGARLVEGPTVEQVRGEVQP